MKRGLILKFILIIFVVAPATGQETSRDHKKSEKEKGKSFALFENDNPLEITLRFDLTTYLKKKTNDQSLKAVLTFNPGREDSVSREVKLKSRGIFRNKYCDFSPIELNFSKADFGYSDLDRISKIKLATECRTGGENDSWILREYLVYRMFNILSDTSFRVRLLVINYVDTGKERKPIRHYGFLIEPVELLSARTGTMPVKAQTLDQRSILPYNMDKVAIFNYMIGNYDWSVAGQHNVRILKSQSLDTLQLGIAVPYDFDWSGVVNASYAVPASNAGVNSVRERIFLGVCRSREVYQQRLEQFAGKQAELINLINNFELLDQREKKDLTGFLDGFFSQLTGRKDLALYLSRNCKKL